MDFGSVVIPCVGEREARKRMWVVDRCLAEVGTLLARTAFYALSEQRVSDVSTLVRVVESGSTPTLSRFPYSHVA